MDSIGMTDYRFVQDCLYSVYIHALHFLLVCGRLPGTPMEVVCSDQQVLTSGRLPRLRHVYVA